LRDSHPKLLLKQLEGVRPLVLQEAWNAPQHPKRPVPGSMMSMTARIVTKVLERFPPEVYPLRLCWEGCASRWPSRTHIAVAAIGLRNPHL
jgi:hypothetical protein